MRIFVTGATGFIGSAVVAELIAAGHQVLGLCRSEAKAPALARAGAEVFAGSVNDLDRIKNGAAQADGVIHLAFNHDFSTFAANCEDDRRVIAALGEALLGTGKPLIVTSGTAIVRAKPGKPVTEADDLISSADIPRAASEEAANAVARAGGNVTILRLPQVHDPVMQGFVTYTIMVGRDKGVFAYVGDGHARWPAAHVADVARLYRLAIERAAPGAIYHAVAEEGVSVRAIAETLGRRLDLPVRSIRPEDAVAHFGWLAMFAALDMPASSALTRAGLGWEPTGPDLLTDLARLQLSEP